jgi:hypothetical protein
MWVFGADLPYRTGHPIVAVIFPLSHCCRQIAVIQLASLNCRCWRQQRHHRCRRCCRRCCLCHCRCCHHRRCTPSLSHHCHPIALVQSPSSNAAIVIINIVTNDAAAAASSSSLAPLPLLSPLPSLSPPSPLLPSSSTLLCRCCFVIVVVVVLLGGQSEELDQTTPQRHCPWHADGAPTLGLAARGPAALTQGHYVPDVILSEISWCLSNGSWR